MTEWKRIEGFEQYSVSNEGEVMGQNGTILKPFATGGGYLVVHLFNNGQRVKKYIHRLVAEAFCVKQPPCNEVNHKDGNKQNNRSCNLEWCTRTENLLHSFYTLKNHVKPVKCLETGVVYPSIKEASRQTGVSKNGISLCCEGKQKRAKKLHWGYAT